MKKLLIVVAALVGSIAAIVLLFFQLTAGVARAGDRFLALVREGKTHEAYLSTAKAFRTATPEEEFGSFLRSSGIVENEAARWDSRSISGATGEIEGSIRTRQGGTVPLKLRLVKEDDEWRILAVERVTAGVLAAPTPAAKAPTVPSDAELQAMATTAVVRLGRALTARDFTEFYGSIAPAWQRQTTPAALRTAFESLLDHCAVVSAVEGRSPVTEKPSLGSNGVLALQGFFPTEPTRVGFTLKYVQEGGAWKLVGANLRLEPAPSAPASPGVVPSESDLEALTQRSMVLLASAVARDSFSELHGAVAEAWKRQISESELRGNFQGFIDNKIPLGAVEASAPVFTEKAGFDSDGMLTVAGYYPTHPFRVTFRLRFLDEGSQWRLAGIEVHAKEE